jgi:hypothetical protein
MEDGLQHAMDGTESLGLATGRPRSFQSRTTTGSPVGRKINVVAVDIRQLAAAIVPRLFVGDPPKRSKALAHHDEFSFLGIVQNRCRVIAVVHIRQAPILNSDVQ